MPNDYLIDQIDTLYNALLQQQKSATALLASFKAATDAQAKIQKALTDPAQASNAVVQNAQTTFVQLRLKEDTIDPLVPDLRRELKVLTTIVTGLKDCGIALRTDPVDVARFDKAIQQLQAIPREEVTALVPELGQELKVAQTALSNDFGYKLRDALAQIDLTLSRTGNNFTIGRFELVVNFESRFVTVRYGKDGVVPRAPITLEGTVKAYQTAAKIVTGRNEDGKTWMGQFYEAYRRVLARQTVKNARVSLVECYVELALLRQSRFFFAETTKRTFKDYTRAEFIYDFYEFTGQQRLAHEGQVSRAHVAAKAQADSPNKSFWIVEGDTPYDGRYIADVEFEKG